MTTNPFALQLKKNLCTGCGICTDSCTYNAIELDEYPVIDAYACRLCGSCVRNCPAGALVLDLPDDVPVVSTSNGKGIWVLAEVENNEVLSVTGELLGKASELSAKLHQDVEAVLIGKGVSHLAPRQVSYGAAKVHVIDNECFECFIEENYALALVKLVRQLNPGILLVGATSRGRGLSARVAAMLQTGLTADCTNLDIDTQTGLLQQIRPAFGGNLMATIVTPNHRPQMASVRPGVMKALSPNNQLTGEIIPHDYSSFKTDSRIQLIGEIQENINEELLENSKIIVGIGRGVKNRQTVVQIEQWAKRIGAAVAGSRAAVEAGLVDASRQVGQTGHTIAPDLYIAIGISGQIQHTAAIERAGKIIAINPDCNAPIFNMADYGWITSIEAILPDLVNIVEA
ncbi:electron transfer flavoprotein subunit alpha [uncultured Bacteroides sp.]|uniref:electron transfer flavoprotein subunit alpha n=1 Tax=uncultured Bacteroides sp. TaxID=162156 RepID=UPI002676D5FC|nr:electron transfer flavoprotein subunit alpha [uncultured Bacteroides sp.]